MAYALTFGEFLNRKRREKNISLRKFAELVKISPVYMCNMEKDRNPAPSEEILNRMVKLLLLNDEEKVLFFDLAAKSKKPHLFHRICRNTLWTEILSVSL